MASSTTASLPMADHYSHYRSSKTVSRLVSPTNGSGLSSVVEQPLKLNGNGADQQSTKTNQQQFQPNQQQLPNYVKTFTQLLSSVGFMSVNDVVYYQLLSLFPVISNVGTVDKDDEDEDELDINDQLSLQKEEAVLSNQYKCDFYHHDCYFAAKDHDEFLRHLEKNHLGQSLYCFYCTKADHHESCSSGASDHLQYSQAEDLINHITTEHLNLKYQCNLCYYRAISVNHVFIHQAVEHLKCFEETLRRSIQDKKDRQQLSLIEQQYLSQLNESRADEDEDTEVEDEDEDSEDYEPSSYKPKSNLKKCNKLCKILVNGPVANKHDDENELKSQTEFYFNQYGFKLEYPNLNEISSALSLIRCAYCMLEAGDKESAEDIWAHCVTSHPHYPIITYDLSQLVKPQAPPMMEFSNDGITTKTVVDLKTRMKKMSQNYNSSAIQSQHNIHKEHNYDAAKFDLDNLGDNLIENIIQTFREHLASNTLPRSYPDNLMKKAFDNFSNQELSLSSTDVDSVDGGVSLEFNDRAEISNNEPTSSSSPNCSKGIKRKIVDDDEEEEEEDSDHDDGSYQERNVTESNRQTRQESIGWVAKRRRTLESFIPESIKRRTKTLASMAATAMAAIGFYQLTNFLPDSVRDYINN